MLADSVVKLGEARFRQKYSFEGPDADRVLEHGIRQALLFGTPFGPRKTA